MRHPHIDIIVEATGNPIAAVDHALAAFKHGKHVVMVTVEADAFCGPLLAHYAQAAGVVYSLAYGDQPALICDLVDWREPLAFTWWPPRAQMVATLCPVHPRNRLGLLRPDARAGAAGWAESEDVELLP